MVARRREVSVEPNPQRSAPVDDAVVYDTPAAPPCYDDFPKPRVRTTAPIADLLEDVRSLVKQGLDRMKAAGGPTGPNDAKTLEALARSAKVAHDLERDVREDLGDRLNKMSDDQVQELAAQLGVDVETLLNGGSDGEG